MAPLEDSRLRKVLLLYLIFLLFITSSAQSRRVLLELEDDDDATTLSIINKKSTPTPTKNLTKIIKPSSKNQTKVTKTPIDATKNQTKLTKPPSDQSAKNKTKLIKPTSLFKKLNSTSNSSPKNGSLLTKKSPDLARNRTSKPTTNKKSKPQMENIVIDTITKPGEKPQKKPIQTDLNDDDDDFVAEFRDLPSKFQESIVPDLERISKTSRGYLTTYNKEFTRGFKPYVGNKYAPTIASLVSFSFIIIPLILVTLIFSKIKAYFSFQKILILIQIYLSIYFSILCLSSLATGLEPLKFFYSTSQSTYVCVQVLQTLAYVLYLLLLLMYLILVFSTETGLSTKLLGLGQTFVGFAVGLHYYVTVFHRAVLHQPPKTSWKAHGLYAACFLVICLLGRVERRKKAYMEGDEEGKMS